MRIGTSSKFVCTQPWSLVIVMLLPCLLDLMRSVRVWIYISTLFLFQITTGCASLSLGMQYVWHQRCETLVGRPAAPGWSTQCQHAARSSIIL